MGMRELEAAILAELKEVSGKTKIRQKDIMEWRTGENSVKAVEGETYYYLPALAGQCRRQVSDESREVDRQEQGHGMSCP